MSLQHQAVTIGQGNEQAAQAEVVNESAVSAQCDALDKHAAAFADAVDTLERTLAPILSPHEGLDGSAGDVIQEVVCPLANRLREVDDRLDENLGRLYRLIARAQL